MKYLLLGCVLVVLAMFYLNSDTFQLKCIVSHKDGNKYCVRDSNHLQESVELLAEAIERMKQIVRHLKEKFSRDERVKLLVKNFNPHRIVETLPTSEYTAYSEDKGQKLAFCLRKYKNDMKLIDLNTLTFVALHELTHLMTASIGHKKEFWDNFKFMLEQANEIGIYQPVDYSQKPSEYCGMTIDNNPFYT
jgi:hypothetical protein